MTPVKDVLMERAIQLSRMGFPAPNPHVGCVIERGGQVVGEGYHDHAGGPHAEINALAIAGTAAEGATAYVTLEPCNHTGRTGPCSEALIAAKVSRVVIACDDPNPRATGGKDRLRAAGIEVVEGVMIEEAENANRMWLTAVRRKRPYVVAKAAMSLDGRIALPNGQSQWITGEAARTQAHVLRAECGAVLVGRKTVELDDPQLTVRHVEAVNQPVRIVLDAGLKLARDRRVFDGSAPTIHVVEKQDAADQLACSTRNGQFDLNLLLTSLMSLGMTSLLVEGGGQTIGAFMAAGFVDRLELFVAPKILGDGPAWVHGLGLNALESAPEFRVKSLKTLEQDLWITAER